MPTAIVDEQTTPPLITINDRKILGRTDEVRVRIQTEALAAPPAGLRLYGRDGLMRQVDADGLERTLCFDRFFGSAGDYMQGIGRCSSTASQACLFDVLFATAIVLPTDVVVDALSITVVTGEVGKSARLGIYEHDADTCLPGALVVDADAVALGASGAKVATFTAITLRAGLHWVAIVSDNTSATFVGWRYTDVMPLDSTGNVQHCAYRLYSYGALPDPFGSSSLGTYNFPRILLRRG